MEMRMPGQCVYAELLAITAVQAVGDRELVKRKRKAAILVAALSV
jgi:hypothetical protein